MKTYYNTNSKSFVTYTNFEPQDKTNLVEISQEAYAEYQEKTSNFYIATIEVVENELVITYTLDEEAKAAAELEALRAKRKPLLTAFDIYKTNVFYSIETETTEEHDTIITWYEAILNLDAEALENVPANIVKYL